VEGETSGEDDDFGGGENDTVRLSFPNELVIAQYRDAEEVTVPVVIPPTSDDDLDDMMIVVDEDAEEAARIQEIETQLKESVREAGLMEPPSTEGLQTGRGKGRVSRGGETPTHQATPKPGSAVAPETTPALGGASADAQETTALGGASAPETAPAPGGASAPRSAPTMGVASALRRTPTLGGTSVPESQVIHGGKSIPVNAPAHGGKNKPMSTPTQGDTPVPVSVAVLRGTSVPENKEKTAARKEVTPVTSTPPAPREVITPVLKAVAGKDKEKLKGAEILSPVIAPGRVARKKISKDQEPEDGATYALIEDSEVASSISVGSSVSNTGRGKKKTAVDDEPLEAEKRGGRNRVFSLMRFGPEHDEYTGQGGVLG